MIAAGNSDWRNLVAAGVHEFPRRAADGSVSDDRTHGDDFGSCTTQSVSYARDCQDGTDARDGITGGHDHRTSLTNRMQDRFGCAGFGDTCKHDRTNFRTPALADKKFLKIHHAV